MSKRVFTFQWRRVLGCFQTLNRIIGVVFALSYVVDFRCVRKRFIRRTGPKHFALFTESVERLKQHCVDEMLLDCLSFFSHLA